MVDGFKISLSYLNQLMWATLGIGATLSVLSPSSDKANILGFSFAYSSLVYMAPLFIVSILLIRQIVISNLADIVRVVKSKTELKELAKSYPLLEFIRWRAPSGLETVLLTIFQWLVLFFPGLAVMVFNNVNFHDRSIASLPIILAPFLIWAISVWNYASLQYKVYEPLCGSIRTPD
jgi:hypothetical protein